MGATNTTANYNLSQFIGTDKPAWLQDYNGDMLKIDTGINAAKVAADGAQNAAGAAQNDATTANNAITNTINPAISSLNTTVGNQGGAINTINSLIGNGTPTTTDQTIIGAINEINDKETLKELQSYTTWTTTAPNAKTLPASFKMLVFAVDSPAGHSEVGMLPAEMIANLSYNHFCVLLPDGYYRFTFSSNTVVCDRVMYNGTNITSDTNTKGITISYY